MTRSICSYFSAATTPCQRNGSTLKYWWHWVSWRQQWWAVSWIWSNSLWRILSCGSGAIISLPQYLCTDCPVPMCWHLGTILISPTLVLKSDAGSELHSAALYMQGTGRLCTPSSSFSEMRGWWGHQNQSIPSRASHTATIIIIYQVSSPCFSVKMKFH